MGEGLTKGATASLNSFRMDSGMNWRSKNQMKSSTDVVVSLCTFMFKDLVPFG